MLLRGFKRARRPCFGGGSDGVANDVEVGEEPFGGT